MDHKTARRWQDILLFGGAAVAFIGVFAFDNTVAALIGFVMVMLSLVVWWMYFRCPVCHVQLGRGNPKRCPHCGAWLGSDPEPTPEKKKIQHKKKRH